MSDVPSFTAVPNEDVAFLGTDPIPTAPFFDPAYYERERHAIFRRTWLHIGRESEVAEPNSFIVRSIQVAPASVLVTRDGDGVLRAFHNVCGHRGSELVADGSGTATNFSCRYHRWNYAQDGTLRAVPDERHFFDLDKAACGLRPISIEVCAGFIFVNLDPEPSQGLREFLGPLADELESSVFARVTEFAQYSYDVDANWKVTFDNFQETYHLRWVHEGSTRGNATGSDNPFGYPTGYRFLGPHRTMSLWSKPDPALSEVQMKAVLAGLAAGDTPDFDRREYYGLFPNIFLAPYAGLVSFSHQVWPLGPERTRGIVRVYFSGDDTCASHRFSREYSVATTMDVHVEDRDVIEASQRGIRSGAFQHLQFQSQEALCRHFNKVVDEAVQRWTTER